MIQKFNKFIKEAIQKDNIKECFYDLIMRLSKKNLYIVEDYVSKISDSFN